MAAVDWTPERTKILIALWEEGLPTSEIGRRLDVTKNSVVGKVHRLGLKKRASPIRAQGSKAAKAPAKAKETAAAKPKAAAKTVASTAPAPAAKAAPAAPAPKPISAPVKAAAPVRDKSEVIRLDTLNNSMCSWPEGEPGTPEFHFCGEPALSDKPYCAPHCARAYVKPSKERKDKSAA